MRAWVPIAISAALLPSVGAAKPPPSLELSSAEFQHDGVLPTSATCDGEGKSPSITWKTEAPAKSFALVTDDPDAPEGPYVHWVLFDIPKSINTIPHGASAGITGTNGADQIGFAPACPPRGGGAHHYRFHLFALDVEKLGVKLGASRADVEAAVKGHVVTETTLTGTYERR